MQRYIIEQVVNYKSKTLGIYETMEEAMAAGDAFAAEGIGVHVCAAITVNEAGEPIPGPRKVFRVW